MSGSGQGSPARSRKALMELLRARGGVVGAKDKDDLVKPRP